MLLNMPHLPFAIFPLTVGSVIVAALEIPWLMLLLSKAPVSKIQSFLTPFLLQKMVLNMQNSSLAVLQEQNTFKRKPTLDYLILLYQTVQHSYISHDYTSHMLAVHTCNANT